MSEKNELAAFIRRHTSQLVVTDAVLDEIVAPFEERMLQKGDHLLHAGRVSGYYLLLKGYVRVYTFTPEGDEVTTYFYGPERAVFDPPSFFFGQPSAEHHQALAPCSGFYISFDQLNYLFHALPVAREFGRAMLVREFALYKQRTLAAITRHAEERYAELLTQQPDLLQHAPLKQVASYLGVTDSSLSRFRRELAERGNASPK